MLKRIILLITICALSTSYVQGGFAQANREPNQQVIRSLPAGYQANQIRMKFVRIPQKGMIGGVAAGTAYYFGMDLTLTRILWVAAALIGKGTIAYILIWVFVPAADRVPEDFDARTGNY